MGRVSFNQNYTSLAVATKPGFSLYNLGEIPRSSGVELPVELSARAEDIFLIQRHYEDTIVALVPKSKRYRLVLWDFGKGQGFPEKDKHSAILAVKFHRRNVIVFLESEIQVNEIDARNLMFDLHKQRKITPNPKGIHAVAYASEDYGLVAVPYKDDYGPDGQVEMLDTVNWQTCGVCTLQSTPVEALAFNPSGSWLVSASKSDESGNKICSVIHVFHVAMRHDGGRAYVVTKELFQFRNNCNDNESILSLSFSTNSQFIVANTNCSSVYLYKLEYEETGYKMSGIELKNISAKEEKRRYENDQRDRGLHLFDIDAVIKLEDIGAAMIIELEKYKIERRHEANEKDDEGEKDENVGSRVCAITTIGDQLRLVIATSDLYLLVYNLPSPDGQYKCLGYYNLNSAYSEADTLNGRHETIVKEKLFGCTIYEASALFNPPEYDEEYHRNIANSKSVPKTIQFKETTNTFTCPNYVSDSVDVNENIIPKQATAAQVVAALVASNAKRAERTANDAQMRKWWNN